MEAVEEKKRSAVKKWLPAIPPVILIILFVLLSGVRPFANFMTSYFSRPVKNFLGVVFSVLPFSIMELEYIAAGVFVIWHVARTVVLTVRAHKRLQVFLRRTLSLLLILLYVFCFFLWCFAIDYRSDSFSEKSGIVTAPIPKEDLRAVTEYFLKNAALHSGDVSRDENGHWAEDMDGYISTSKTLYTGLSREFPFLSASSRIPKKMYLFSRLSSHMGFTGVYFPFSGESNINIDAPGCLIPCTIAHELAHQKGVYSETEANFVGVAASISSGDPVYVYSGYLNGAIYLSNALYDTDPAAWSELSALITGPMLVDWRDNNAYWASFDGPIEEVSSKVYDGYLKAQGQPLGIRSYDACVELLVAYYLKAATS